MKEDLDEPPTLPAGRGGERSFDSDDETVAEGQGARARASGARSTEAHPRPSENEAPVRDPSEPSPTSSSLPSSSLAPGGLTIASPIDAMRRDERTRYRLLGLVGVIGSAAAAATTPFVAASSEVRALALVGLAMVFVTNAWLIWLSASDSRFDQRSVAAAWAIASVGVLFTAAFFGLHSAAVMALVLGIYIVSRSTMRGLALAVYLTAAVGHAVLVIITGLGGLADGVVRAVGAGFFELLAIEFLVQTMLFGTYVVGRQAQHALDATLTELDRALRGAALRQALLDEARVDFARAARIGGLGRLSGVKLGGYELGDVLGRGGMGEVYAARRMDDEGEAAVKVLYPHLLSDPEMVERFLRESRAVGSLSSPHVVSVLEVGTPDAGVPYIAMERLRGRDLAERLRGKARLSLESALALAEQIVEGLERAGELGIVHRDIKPQNLFESRDEAGEVTWKILDFGVSKLAGGTGTLTSGKLIGTPRYVAPEQAMGKDVDRRADFYALGAVLYRCLTGRPPFAGHEMHEILYAVDNRMPVQPTRLVELPGDVDAFFALALAKDPAERLEPSAFVSALRAALAGELSPTLRERAEVLAARAPWARAF